MKWVETEKKTFKKESEKIDRDKTHGVGRDKGNLTLSESDLNMTRCVAAWLHSLVPPPRHVETQNRLPTKLPHHFPPLIHHHSLTKEGVKIAAAGWLALLSG